eukprot:1769500-Rhodomonas_salina.1
MSTVRLSVSRSSCKGPGYVLQREPQHMAELGWRRVGYLRAAGDAAGGVVEQRHAKSGENSGNFQLNRRREDLKGEKTEVMDAQARNFHSREHCPMMGCITIAAKERKGGSASLTPLLSPSTSAVDTSDGRRATKQTAEEEKEGVDEERLGGLWQQPSPLQSVHSPSTKYTHSSTTTSSSTTEFRLVQQSTFVTLASSSPITRYY